MTIDWSAVRHGRNEATRILPPLRRVPLADSVRAILSNIVTSDDILDIGANDRNILDFLNTSGHKFTYSSFDIDRSLTHDYYDLATIDRQFSLILILDVIEHLQPDDAFSLLKRCFELLKPNGQILLSTPNVDHPVRFWRDCTHITPFRYDELYGFLLSTGFKDIEIFRLKKMRLKDWLRYVIALPVLRLLDIDFAPGLAFLARRNN